MLPHHPLLAGDLLLPAEVPAVLTPDALQVGVHDHLLLSHRQASDHLLHAKESFSVVMMVFVARGLNVFYNLKLGLAV